MWWDQGIGIQGEENSIYLFPPINVVCPSLSSTQAHFLLSIETHKSGAMVAFAHDIRELVLQ
jgi:hypothetical protein